MDYFILFVILLVILYIIIAKSKNEISKQLEQYNGETSRKLKILVDNQMELHEILRELSVENMADGVDIDDIDKVITDIEFEKAKKEILEREGIEIEDLKAKYVQNEDLKELIPNLKELSEQEKLEGLEGLMKDEQSLDLEQLKEQEEEQEHELVKETLLANDNLFSEEEKEVEVVEVEEIIELETLKDIRNQLKEAKKEKPEQKATFKERFPDLEKFIGENLINKIGIVITVLGIIFSVKYAIDNEYINEAGRVLIGIGAGGLLIGIAHKLRLKYTSFSSVLVGGGLATLYFTIGLAFQEYQIFSQTVAFAIMLVITIFAVLLSILYGKQELAVLAIIGGFATPLAVSTGAGNYKILFSYLLLLNVGMLALAYFKKWRIVNIVSYFFTIIMFSAWLGDSVSKNKLPLNGAFFFATIFYFVFFFQNIIYNLKESKKFKAWEFFILLSNSFAYFGAGLYILHNSAPEFKGFFTALVSIFNFIFAFSLYKKSEIDRNLVYLLIGLVLSFISLIGPIQLHGNYITLFWAAEAVILLWMWQKTEIKLIKLSSVLVLSVMFFSLFMDWEKIYSHYSEIETMSILLNKGFLTGLTVLVSLVLLLILLTKEKPENFLANLKVKHYSLGLQIAFVGVLYSVFLLEISYHLNIYFENVMERNAILSAYNIAYILGLIIWLSPRKSKINKQVALGFGLLALTIYALYVLPTFAQLRDLSIEGKSLSSSPFVLHYISLFMIFLLVAFNFLNVKKLEMFDEKAERFNLWFSVFLVLGILSAEIDNFVLFSYFDYSTLVPQEGFDSIYSWQITDYKDSILSQSHKIAFPVLWGVSSFVLMVIGLRKDMRDLRIISLVVFFITVFKLFAIDVWDMAEGGRILAFVLLGVLLLIISFMYQKLKHLVLEKEDEQEIKE